MKRSTDAGKKPTKTGDMLTLFLYEAKLIPGVGEDSAAVMSMIHSSASGRPCLFDPSPRSSVEAEILQSALSHRDLCVCVCGALHKRINLKKWDEKPGLALF